MSSIVKSGISLSKKDLSKSRLPTLASRNVVFYHKATGGELSINLLALSMPSEMPTMVQATNDEISGAKLVVNKKNLSLHSSINGELIQGLHYEVTSGTSIQLKGPYVISGAEVDEIFVGTINSAPMSDIVVASARSIDKTYTLAIGSYILNLGREYKVGMNINDNIGSIKVFVNGVLAHRGSEYYEIDSGNGYGTTIGFYAAPISIAYDIAVDFGVMSVTDHDALGTIESHAGAIKKLADDLADVAGTAASDYLSANPSEVERRAFGDNVLKLQTDLLAAIALMKAKTVLNWGFSAGMTTTTASVNTKIANITGGNQTGSWADYFTITPSATLGTTFVAKKRFLLTAFVASNSSGSDTYNISVNSSQLTSAYSTLGDNTKLTAPIGFGAAGGGAGARIIEAGDVLRLHIETAAFLADGWFKLIFSIDEAV